MAEAGARARPSAAAARPIPMRATGDSANEREYIRLVEKSTKLGAHKAVKALRKAIALMPEREEAYHNLVQELSKFGTNRSGEVTATLVKLLRIQPPGTVAWAGNVMMLWLQSKTEDGHVQLKADPPDWWTDEGLRRVAVQVVDLQPKLVGSHLMLAEVLNGECVERPGQPRWLLTRDRTAADYRRAAQAYRDTKRMSMQDPKSQVRPIGPEEPVTCIHHRLQQHVETMDQMADQLEMRRTDDVAGPVPLPAATSPVPTAASPIPTVEKLSGWRAATMVNTPELAHNLSLIADPDTSPFPAVIESEMQLSCKFSDYTAARQAEMAQTIADSLGVPASSLTLKLTASGSRAIMKVQVATSSMAAAALSNITDISVPAVAMPIPVAAISADTVTSIQR